MCVVVLKLALIQSKRRHLSDSCKISILTWHIQMLWFWLEVSIIRNIILSFRLHWITIHFLSLDHIFGEIILKFTTIGWNERQNNRNQMNVVGHSKKIETDSARWYRYLLISSKCFYKYDYFVYEYILIFSLMRLWAKNISFRGFATFRSLQWMNSYQTVSDHTGFDGLQFRTIDLLDIANWKLSINPLGMRQQFNGHINGVRIICSIWYRSNVAHTTLSRMHIHVILLSS